MGRRAIVFQTEPEFPSCFLSYHGIGRCLSAVARHPATDAGSELQRVDIERPARAGSFREREKARLP